MRTRLTRWLTAAALFAVPAAVAAQPGGERRSPRPPQDVQERPGIDAEARAELREIRERSRKEMGEVGEKLREARRELEELLSAEEVNEEAAMKAVDRIAELQAEQLKNRVRTRVAVTKQLGPEKAQVLQRRARQMRGQRGAYGRLPMARPGRGGPGAGWQHGPMAMQRGPRGPFGERGRAMRPGYAQPGFRGRPGLGPQRGGPAYGPRGMAPRADLPGRRGMPGFGPRGPRPGFERPPTMNRDGDRTTPRRGPAMRRAPERPDRERPRPERPEVRRDSERRDRERIEPGDRPDRPREREERAPDRPERERETPRDGDGQRDEG